MAKPLLYEIQVERSLDPSWSEWLDGMTISQDAGDATLLSGPIRDQAALFGLLIKLRDMGLNLISVNRVETRDNVSKLGGERK
jgi:hypothetical protein